MGSSRVLDAEVTEMAESADSALKHTIPVIDKMMDVLAVLERRDGGATIRDLVDVLDLPRTTVYRILNTLAAHEVVHRDDAGTYVLGRRLLSLAAHVAAGANEVDLVSLGQPFLEKLSVELGEGAKLSVIDYEGILVIAAVQGRREYALAVAPGQRMPIHAGAASKLLLAHLPPEDQANWLDRPLVAYTSKSITDPMRLAKELARIKRLGWAQDKGENAPSIQAFAAPVFNAKGKMMAAISVPFLAGAEASRMEEIRLAVIAAAKAMTEAMPG